MKQQKQCLVLFSSLSGICFNKIMKLNKNIYKQLSRDPLSDDNNNNNINNIIIIFFIISGSIINIIINNYF